MTELEVPVPDRVPEPLGDRGNVSPSIVEQDQVEIALRPQDTASVAADGHECHLPGIVADRRGEELEEPDVGCVGASPAVVGASEVMAGDQVGGGGCHVVRSVGVTITVGAPGREVQANGERRPTSPSRRRTRR